MLAGCLAFALCLVPAIAGGNGHPHSRGTPCWPLPPLTSARSGFTGWLTPRAWPGYMPPITLLSCLLLAAPLAAKLIRKHE